MNTGIRTGRTLKIAAFLVLVVVAAGLFWYFRLDRRERSVAKVPDISPADFEKIINQGKPGILEFYTTSCPYCRLMVPVLEQLQADYGDRIFVVTMNAERYPSEAAKYEVPGVPALIFFDAQGKVADSVVGYHDYDAMVGVLKQLKFIN
ncbi:MAG TPA: thioredoxin family protein [Firmicutes bacterium]|nr:thioredoxin family protein [Candidatus Fermentithermobacillaceae bacterium]